jgi:hypothetical protein
MRFKLMMRRNAVFPVLLINLSMICVGSGKDNLSLNDTLLKSSYSLQVQWDDLFTIFLSAPTSGIKISLKKHFSNRSAIRIGCIFNPQAYNSNDDREPDEENEYPMKQNGYNKGCELNLNYIHYIIQRNRNNLYLSVGPYYHKSENKSNYSMNWDGTNASGYEVGIVKERIKSMGLNISMGLEILLTKTISVITEYGFNASYNSSDEDDFIIAKTYTNEGNTRDEYQYQSKKNSFNLNSSVAKIGFSKYF